MKTQIKKLRVDMKTQIRKLRELTAKGLKIQAEELTNRLNKLNSEIRFKAALHLRKLCIIVQVDDLFLISGTSHCSLTYSYSTGTST